MLQSYVFHPSNKFLLKSNIIYLVAFIVYLTSAIYNIGYYHYDEHYQIIEFAEFKTGKNQELDLAWEYQAKIRPALQPFVCYLFLKTTRFIGINDPYLTTTLLRLLCALSSLFVIRAFISCLLPMIDSRYHLAYISLSLLLCFVPFINVRFTSENLSALTFMIGFILLLKDRTYSNLILSGLCLGLSFLFRYQSAVLILGLIIWMILVENIKTKKLCVILSGILLSVYVGFLIDLWFYKVPVYPFIDYFNINLFQGVASNFGTEPWYYYFTEFSSKCTLPIAAIMSFGVLFYFVKNPKSVFTWIVAPFLLLHILIPHKELRFLFPVANFVPLLIMLSYQQLIGSSHVKRGILAFCIIVLSVINLTVLTVNTFSPADGHGRINITKYIRRHYHNKPITLNYVDNINPYRPIEPTQQFYLDANVRQEQLTQDYLTSDSSKNFVMLVLAQQKDVNYLFEKFKKAKLKHLSSGVPSWIQKIENATGYGSPGTSFELFEIVH